MRKVLSCFLMVFLFNSLIAQESFLVDERDGQVYPTEEINGVLWMAEDLRWNTELSVELDSVQQNKMGEFEGHFYHLEDLDCVCPAGWQLPKASDWIDYFVFISKGREATVRFKAYRENIEVRGYEDELDVFADDNLLNLKPTGIIQGKEHIYKGGYANYWITDLPTQKDIMFEAKGRSMRLKHVRVIYEGKSHIHLGNPWTQIHSHDHHLEPEVEDEIRRFMVRCVRYSENP